jgi:hypothetical protein
MTLDEYRDMLRVAAGLRLEKEALSDDADAYLHRQDYETFGVKYDQMWKVKERLMLIRDELHKEDNLPRDEDAMLSSYAWPGGYEVVYYTQDGGTLCVECAQSAEGSDLTHDNDDPQWNIVAAQNTSELEGFMYCDDCGKAIVEEEES